MLIYVAIVVVIIIIVIFLLWPRLPSGIQNGDVLKCPSSLHIYYISNNKKRYFSWEAFVKAGRPTPKIVDCKVLEQIPPGPDM